MEEYSTDFSKMVIGENDGELRYVVQDLPLTEKELSYPSAVARKLMFTLPERP